MKARPVILDCDPGHDDAVAIPLALASPDEIDLPGITAVAGNVPLRLTESNARRFCELAGRPQVKVFAGCDRPLLRKLRTAEAVHGSSGIQGADLPPPSMALQQEHAVDFIVRTCLAAADREVTICPIGPLTNVAAALVRAPRIVPKIREIVVMGGAVRAMGNTTPVAEFNIFVDPHAADVVLRAGAPVTMMPLDVTHQALVTPARLERFRALGGPVGRCTAGMLEFYIRFDMARYGVAGGPLHDPCVIAYLIDPTLFSGRDVHVEVELASPLTLGQTVGDWWNIMGQAPNAHVCHEIDDAGFFDLILERLGRL